MYVRQFKHKIIILLKYNHIEIKLELCRSCLHFIISAKNYSLQFSIATTLIIMNSIKASSFF